MVDFLHLVLFCFFFFGGMSTPPMVVSIRSSKANTSNVSNKVNLAIKITLWLGFYAYCKSCWPHKICRECRVVFLYLSFTFDFDYSFCQKCAKCSAYGIWFTPSTDSQNIICVKYSTNIMIECDCGWKIRW